MVLGYTLRKHGWTHPRVAVVTAGVSAPAREELARWWDRIVEVETIANPTPAEGLWFPYFRDLYTKLRLWTMTEYDKIVYMDTDVLVTGSIEELLDRPRFAAAPCTTPPDTLNGGVIVLEPDVAVYEDMISKMHTLPSHDGSEQGFLNSYFSDWYTGPAEHRLPCIFNVNQTLFMARGGWQRVLPDMRALHFVSPAKPWRKRYYRFARFGYRWMSKWARGARGTTPMGMWMAAWHEATGSPKPPWRTPGPWR